MECLDPPLQEVPVDEWFCPGCASPGAVASPAGSAAASATTWLSRASRPRQLGGLWVGAGAGCRAAGLEGRLQSAQRLRSSQTRTP